MKKMTPEELEQFIHRELRALPPRKAPAGFEARLSAAIQESETRRALSPGRLEQLVHRELRMLPLRRAPRTLEARVLAALEQQAAIAWYHKSWSYWPAAIRASFLAVSTAVTGAVVAAFYLGLNGVDTAAVAAQAGEQLSLFSRIYHAAGWIADLGARVFDSIPSLWLYGSLALIAALYATFFGLGAAAYRTLYRNN